MKGKSWDVGTMLSSMDKSSSNKYAVPAEEHPLISYILTKIAPLRLKVSGAAALRVNVLIGIIDFNYFFGGYISVFNFAKRLSREGYNIRMIIVDKCSYDPYLWRRKIKNYEGLEDFFERSEVVYAFDRSAIIECNPGDAFVATSWWTAYIANAALDYVEADRFLYFSQEYEPIFYNHSSLYSMVNMTYEMPHCAIFSTELLRDFHRHNGIGLFKGGGAAGEQYSVAFANAVVKVVPDEAGMNGRKKRRLLFYARPEIHAARNLFELGILALARAVRNGAFDAGQWEFYGIGTLKKQRIMLDAGRDIAMKLLPKVSLNAYKELLPQFDIGMSLMLSPHPSLVPIEMASAGMIVVTNTCANKTAEQLRKISTNFVAAEPTMDGIALSLAVAAKRSLDFQDRIMGAAVDWPQSWEKVFSEYFMDKVKGFIKQDIEAGAGSLVTRGCERRELIIHLKQKYFFEYYYAVRDGVLPPGSRRKRVAERIIGRAKAFKRNFRAWLKTSFSSE
jgi:hypothetical protein